MGVASANLDLAKSVPSIVLFWCSLAISQTGRDYSESSVTIRYVAKKHFCVMKLSHSKSNGKLGIGMESSISIPFHEYEVVEH